MPQFVDANSIRQTVVSRLAPAHAHLEPANSSRCKVRSGASLHTIASLAFDRRVVDGTLVGGVIPLFDFPFFLFLVLTSDSSPCRDMAVRECPRNGAMRELCLKEDYSATLVSGDAYSLQPDSVNGTTPATQG